MDFELTAGEIVDVEFCPTKCANGNFTKLQYNT